MKPHLSKLPGVGLWLCCSAEWGVTPVQAYCNWRGALTWMRR